MRRFRFDGTLAVIQAMVGVLAELPQAQRDTLIETNAAALGTLASGDRVTRMTDMMAAVAELPGDKRGAIMEKMASIGEDGLHAGLRECKV